MNMRIPFVPFVMLIFTVLLGCDAQPSAKVTTSDDVGTVNTELEPAKTIAVKVTGMMCPHSCLKDVKQLIEKKNDVVSIELTPQKDPDVIDNPVVVVKYRGDLHQEETTSAILAAGFEKVEYFESIAQ